MNVIRHDHIPAHAPEVRRTPGVGNQSRRLVVGQQRLSTARAYGEKDNSRPKSNCDGRKMRRPFPTRAMAWRRGTPPSIIITIIIMIVWRHVRSHSYGV